FAGMVSSASSWAQRRTCWFWVSWPMAGVVCCRPGAGRSGRPMVELVEVVMVGCLQKLDIYIFISNRPGRCKGLRRDLRKNPWPGPGTGYTAGAAGVGGRCRMLTPQSNRLGAEHRGADPRPQAGGDDQHRTGRMPQHRRGRAADQEFVQPAVAVRAHDDQVGVQAVGLAEDARRGLAGYERPVRIDADLAQA